jgi:hypothetical protein
MRKPEIEGCVVIPNFQRLWRLVFTKEPDEDLGIMSGVQLLREKFHIPKQNPTRQKGKIDQKRA